MSGVQGQFCSVSKKPGKVLAALYAYDSSILADLDNGEMAGLFHVTTFQVRPITFDFSA